MKKYHRQNGACFAGALFAVLFSSLFAVTLQFFKGDVLDCAVAGETEEALRAAVLLIGFILGEVLLYFLYRLFAAKYAVGCTRRLKHDIFENILRRSFVDYKRQTRGEYIAKYTSDADAIKARRFEMLPLLWEILFKILLVSVALFLLDWRIALLTITLLTTPLYLPKLVEKRLQKAQTECLQTAKRALDRVNDWLSGFEIIKNFAIERKVLTMFEAVNDSAMAKLLRDRQLNATAQLITTVMSYLSYFAVLSCAAALVLMGEFSAGDFFVAIGMIDQLSWPLISLAEIIRQLIAIRPTCEEMMQFVAETDETPMTEAPASFREEICFHSVTFGYDNQVMLLQNFDLRIRKGERCLLRGRSGCGKTTTINLLLHYYDPADGEVLLDGVPVASAGNPYGCMTVVRQEAVLFHDTLRNNLTMTRQIPDERLIEILKSLDLEKFAMAEALDQLIVENGANLSGGEKKRICLARALLRETEILILDEPLANLDAATAGKIEDLLLSIRDRTMLVVSHQFSNEKIDAFDQIVDYA